MLCLIQMWFRTDRPMIYFCLNLTLVNYFPYWRRLVSEVFYTAKKCTCIKGKTMLHHHLTHGKLIPQIEI